MKDINKSSVLKLDHIAFEKIDFRRNGDVRPDMKYSVNFTRDVKVSDDGAVFKVSLGAHIRSKNDEDYQLDISLAGYFVCDETEEQIKATLIQDNTIAILFPYLRSQISLVTTQPDMMPIVLPPMNIIEMFRKDSIDDE